MATHNERRVGGGHLPYWLGACVFLAVAGFFLWEEHRAHLLGVLPYLLLLICPVVHLFMHGGHESQHTHASPQQSSPDGRAS